MITVTRADFPPPRIFQVQPSTPVRIAYRHIRPLTVVYVRSTGCYQTAANEAWQRLGDWLAQRQARRQVKRGFGLFHDNPQVTAPELLRYDACVEIIGDLDVDAVAGIGRQTISGGTYAVHTHVGAYEPIGTLFSQLHREWVPKRGLAVDYDRPFVAVYLNDPLMTREVHRRTELCIPVLPLRTSVGGEADQANEAGGEDEGAAPPLAGPTAAVK